MIDKLFKRKQQLEELIEETFSLLHAQQQRLISERNPLEINSIRRDIRNLREVSEEFTLE